MLNINRNIRWEAIFSCCIHSFPSWRVFTCSSSSSRLGRWLKFSFCCLYSHKTEALSTFVCHTAEWSRVQFTTSRHVSFTISLSFCLPHILSFSVSLRPQAVASQSILAWRLTWGMNTSQLAIHAPPLPFSPPHTITPLLPSSVPFLQDPSLSTYLKLWISCILIGVSIFLSPPHLPLFFDFGSVASFKQTTTTKQPTPPSPPPPHQFLFPFFKSIFAISE